MDKVALNARFYSHRTTGMQRYAIEISRRLRHGLEEIRPAAPLTGAKGHLWEQGYLPVAVGSRLLWSPNNTGPLVVRRQICTFHDLIPLERPDWFSKGFAAWYGWLLPRLARSVPHLIAISEFTKSRIAEICRVPENRITVVPNGVDERFQPATPAAIAAMRTALGIESRDYLVYVGSLEPRKNLRGLLEAWSRIQDSSGGVELVVAGAKGRSQVFAGAGLSEIPPRVFFTGYVPDEHLPALYSGALGAVYPSLYEGFGLPPLEAMACGTPVITSSTTSLPEVTGKAALLVDPAKISEIAEAMKALIGGGQLREQLRLQGLARAAQFTWDRAAQSTWGVLEAYA